MLLTIETPVLLGILAALFAPLAAYLVAVRQFSGKIESSAAADLWAESRAIRDWSQARISELNAVVRRLEERVYILEEENRKLFKETVVLEDERDGLIARCNQKINKLTAKLEQANKRIAELEKEANGNGN